MFVSSLLLLVLVPVVSGQHGCIREDSPIKWGTIRLPRGSEILSLKDFDKKVCFKFVLKGRLTVCLSVCLSVLTVTVGKPTIRHLRQAKTHISEDRALSEE